MASTNTSGFHITFYPTEAAARALAERNGGEAEGFVVAPVVGRPGQFVIKVLDADAGDGFFLGYL